MQNNRVFRGWTEKMRRSTQIAFQCHFSLEVGIECDVDLNANDFGLCTDCDFNKLFMVLLGPFVIITIITYYRQIA